MNPRFLLAPLFLSAAAMAADLPAIPPDSIAKKKELLFSDDFEKPELGKAWGQVVPTFTVEKGELKGTQTRLDVPAADGKPAVQGHQAVIGNDIPTKDSVVECKIRFAGAASMSVEFDDRKFTGSHYGHICSVRVSPKNVSVTDQAEGGMRNDIYEMRDPAKKDERNKLLVGRSANFPVTLDPEKPHTLVVETVGDSMRAVIDGKPVAFLKSPGIAHETKSKIELGCAGHDGFFDDVKVWNAEPAKP